MNLVDTISGASINAHRRAEPHNAPCLHLTESSVALILIPFHYYGIQQQLSLQISSKRVTNYGLMLDISGLFNYPNYTKDEDRSFCYKS